MKTAKGGIFLTVSISMALISIGCEGAINNAVDGWAAFGYTLLALVILMLAIVFAALGVDAENEYRERENRKVKRAPTHSNDWRNAQ